MKTLLKTISNYFVGVWKELTKVAWPSRTTVINHTIVVLVSAVVVMAVVGVIDYGLSTSFQYLISLKK